MINLNKSFIYCPVKPPKEKDINLENKVDIELACIPFALKGKRFFAVHPISPLPDNPSCFSGKVVLNMGADSGWFNLEKEIGRYDEFIQETYESCLKRSSITRNMLYNLPEWMGAAFGLGTVIEAIFASGLYLNNFLLDARTIGTSYLENTLFSLALYGLITFIPKSIVESRDKRKSLDLIRSESDTLKDVRSLLHSSKYLTKFIDNEECRNMGDYKDRYLLFDDIIRRLVGIDKGRNNRMLMADDRALDLYKTSQMRSVYWFDAAMHIPDR